MENKKGVTTLALIAIIFFALFLIILLAIVSYAAGLFDSQISKLDINLGNFSFNETYQEAMHPSMEVIEVSGPRMISMGVLFGMVLLMLIVGAKTEKKHNLWIILDIVIIIVAEIIAVYIKTVFQDTIMNLSPELYQIFITTLSSASKWILNMPTIIPTVGVLIILATYVLKKEEDEGSEEGFYQIEDE
jgi:hypothetical protein